jgi:hypothetical protein
MPNEAKKLLVSAAEINWPDTGGAIVFLQEKPAKKNNAARKILTQFFMISLNALNKKNCWGSLFAVVVQYYKSLKHYKRDTCFAQILSHILWPKADQNGIVDPVKTQSIFIHKKGRSIFAKRPFLNFLKTYLPMITFFLSFIIIFF